MLNHIHSHLNPSLFVAVICNSFYHSNSIFTRFCYSQFSNVCRLHFNDCYSLAFQMWTDIRFVIIAVQLLEFQMRTNIAFNCNDVGTIDLCRYMYAYRRRVQQYNFSYYTDTPHTILNFFLLLLMLNLWRDYLPFGCNAGKSMLHSWIYSICRISEVKARERENIEWKLKNHPDEGAFA